VVFLRFIHAVLLGAVFTASTGAITFTFTEPRAGAGLSFPFTAQAVVASEFEVRSVTATLSTQAVSLVFSEGRWVAPRPFDLSTVPSGNHDVVFRAEDVFGTVAEERVPITIDRPMKLTIHSPRTNSVARPMMHVDVSCEDDLGGCIIDVWDIGATIVARGTNHLVGDFDVSQSEGGFHRIFVRATGGVNKETQQISTLIDVVSLSNPRYQQVARAPGAILDFNESSLVYRGTENGFVYGGTENEVSKLKLVDRQTGQVTTIATNADTVTWAAVTPTGATYLKQETIWDFNRGELLNAGPAQGFDKRVKGGYGYFGTILRDFVARTNLTLPDGGGLYGDVAANGVAIFSTRYRPAGLGYGIDSTNGLYIVKDGLASSFSPDQPAYFLVARTDGTNFVWANGSSFWAATAQGNVLLSTNVAAGYDDQYLAINQGWIAFARLGSSGQTQIWRRSPAGVEEQVTFFNESSRIRALGPDGSLVFSVGEGFAWSTNRLYFSRPGKAPQFLHQDLGGKYVFKGATLYAILGDMLFTVQPEGDLVGVTSPQAGTNEFSFYVTSTTNGQYVVERSPNLVRWSPVQTNTIPALDPQRVSVEGGPAFFRVVPKN
jgi:hypothetical protein